MKKLFIIGTRMLLISLVLLMLISCSGIETSRKVMPTSLKIKDTLQMPFKVAKCLYDHRSNTYYVWEQNRPFIHFYRQKQLMNTIGGMGIDNVSFQKLSDIAIDSEGNLLAIDAFAKLIRKFSSDGKWIANIELPDFSQPSKFCITSENDLIIFDSAPKELKRLSSFSGKEMFSFGKFQVENVSHISSSRDFVAIVSASEGKTLLFSAMGLMLKELPYQLVLDSYQNQYYYSEGALRTQDGELILPFGWSSKDVNLYATSQTLLLVYDNTIVTIEPDYKRE
jgi:hypothetical protein